MTPTQWSRQDEYKAQWRNFMQTAAFREAIMMLKEQAIPFIVRGDTPETMATRQAYQAGYQACIKLLQTLPTLAKRNVTDEVLQEWGHYKPETASN